ncbi:MULTISPECIES: glycine betaine ABC transporter substrate-binding protein [Shouchella]|uniref:glycine betaine ABC transporter substrate-binding protein n=1 Tax=Shouchella TaxID=2893057 RepID=UPI00270D116E|nr:glycine betaine ABC transporter substrate-binding protein [Shouchella clausii]MDO7269333.1 glycine betaine ABC transporter substrate-binding protein [Shouchella clausii]MDO7289215.1 glycine betaine ABC transporter substrate-binding protein [Shouchella clausii]
MNVKHVTMTATGLALAVTLAACGNGDDNGNGSDSNPVGSTDEGMISKEDIQKDLSVITGIDPGAGVSQAAERAIEDYDLTNLTLQTSSSSSMAQALDTAIQKHEPIVVTAWNPHWKFAAYDLKYLDDPEGSFGGTEEIHTIARQGLESEKPEGYQVVDNFFWSEDDMNEVMLAVHEGADPAEAAQEWVDNNQEKVDEWIDGVDTVDGESFSLVLVNWDSEVASSNVLALALEQVGYDVELSVVENGPMWKSLESGDQDASVAAWLPITHGSFFDESKVDDLGVNLDGEPRIGLAVPSYMDIDSIEDLKAE